MSMIAFYGPGGVLTTYVGGLSVPTRSMGTFGVGLVATFTGLGAPFLGVVIRFDRLAGLLAWLRRYGTAAVATSADVEAAMDILLVLDRVAWATSLGSARGLTSITDIGTGTDTATTPSSPGCRYLSRGGHLARLARRPLDSMKN